MAGRNPQKVVDAACAGAVEVAGLTLRPFVLGLFPVLQKLKSPLLANQAGEKRRLETEDILRLILCLSIEPAQARRLVAAGLEAFDEAALAKADLIPLAALPELGEAITRLFRQALATAPSVAQGVREAGLSAGGGESKKNGAAQPSASGSGESPRAGPGTAGI